MRNLTHSALVALSFFFVSSTALAQAVKARETETFLINYNVFKREPAVGFGLSVIPGFGAGHFYAEQNTKGIIFAGGEMLGAGLFGGGIALTHRSTDAGEIVMLIGGIIYSAFKLVDIFLAPYSVERYNKSIAKGLQIQALYKKPKKEDLEEEEEEEEDFGGFAY